MGSLLYNLLYFISNFGDYVYEPNHGISVRRTKGHNF